MRSGVTNLREGRKKEQIRNVLGNEQCKIWLEGREMYIKVWEHSRTWDLSISLQDRGSKKIFYWSPNLDLLFRKYMLLIRSRQAQNNIVYHSSLPLLENRGTKSSAYGD